MIVSAFILFIVLSVATRKKFLLHLFGKWKPVSIDSGWVTGVNNRIRIIIPHVLLSFKEIYFMIVPPHKYGVYTGGVPCRQSFPVACNWFGATRIHSVRYVADAYILAAFKHIYLAIRFAPESGIDAVTR